MISGCRDARARLEFDGAFEGQTVSYGWLVKQDGQRIADGAGTTLKDGKGTSNVAEYHALIKGLLGASDLDLDRLDIYGDSKLIINQVTGRWDCEAAHLLPLRQQAWELIEDMEKRGCRVTLNWIPGAENAEADALSRGADLVTVRELACAICGLVDAAENMRLISGTAFCVPCYNQVRIDP